MPAPPVLGSLRPAARAVPVPCRWRKAQRTASAALEAAFDFMEQAFARPGDGGVRHRADGGPGVPRFLTENGCERYFKYNKDLLLDHRKAALQQELATEQRRHGGECEPCWKIFCSA